MKTSGTFRMCVILRLGYPMLVSPKAYLPISHQGFRGDRKDPGPAKEKVAPEPFTQRPAARALPGLLG